MGRTNKTVIGHFLSAVLLLLSMSPVMAEDTREPIYIESDSLDIDDQKGVSIYRGNVHFRRGTANLWADEVKIIAPDRKDVERIIAEGSPAKFRQLSDEKGKDATGQAGRIEYRADESLVILDGDARLQQGENLFAGNRIEYDSGKKIVRAGKSVDAKEGRVKIMIQPEEESAQDGATETESKSKSKMDEQSQP